MADIPNWLKGFQRPRSTHAPTPSSDRINVFDDTKEIGEEMQRPHNTNRMSSYLDISSLSAQSTSMSNQPHINQVDQIWHKPSLDQMAETLKVAMMTQRSFDPLDVRFNSCILHVLEAYHDIRRALTNKDREIQDLKQSREEIAKTFEQQASRWKEREGDYKSEMKKLEVMLATRTRGLELVTLARSESVLNRERGTTATQDGSTKGGQEDLWLLRDREGIMTTDFAEKIDRYRTAGYFNQRRSLNSHNLISTTRQQCRPMGVAASCESSNGGQAHAKGQREQNTHSCPFDQHYPTAYSNISSDSPPLAGPAPGHHTGRHAQTPSQNFSPSEESEQPSNAIDNSKPLPDIPGSPNLTAPRSLLEEMGGIGSHSEGNTLDHLHAHQRGFSFVPGDDYGKLPIGEGRTRATVRALEAFTNSQTARNSSASMNTGASDQALGEKARQSKPISITNRKMETTTSKQKKPGPCGGRQPKRDDSQSSVVTAIRNNSGRSSKGSESVNKDAPESPKLNRHARGNEATIAAIRAIVESEKNVTRTINGRQVGVRVVHKPVPSKQNFPSEPKLPYI